MSVAGVVLAAGASSRMGTPKALLRIGERTFLQNMARALIAGGCRPVMAVVAEPVEALRSACRLDGIELVVNPDPSRGQISSLGCALDAAPDVDGVLVVLVDQGGIEPGTIRSVRLALQSAPLAVARHRGNPGHPTAFGKELFAALRSRAAERNGARIVVEARTALGEVAWVDVDDPGVVRNLNTPDDVSRALDDMLAGRP